MKHCCSLIPVSAYAFVFISDNSNYVANWGDNYECHALRGQSDPHLSSIGLYSECEKHSNVGGRSASRKLFDSGLGGPGRCRWVEDLSVQPRWKWQMLSEMQPYISRKMSKFDSGQLCTTTPQLLLKGSKLRATASAAASEPTGYAGNHFGGPPPSPPLKWRRQQEQVEPEPLVGDYDGQLSDHLAAAAARGGRIFRPALQLISGGPAAVRPLLAPPRFEARTTAGPEVAATAKLAQVVCRQVRRCDSNPTTLTTAMLLPCYCPCLLLSTLHHHRRTGQSSLDSCGSIWPNECVVCMTCMLLGSTRLTGSKGWAVG